MQQEILQNSLLQQWTERDVKEANIQLKIMHDCLTKIINIINEGNTGKDGEELKFIDDNQRFLKEKVMPKIKNLQKELENYANNKKEIEPYYGDKKTKYQEFDQKMQGYYDNYKIIWAQVYYYSQRKRILLNQDTEKKQQLVQKLLQ